MKTSTFDDNRMISMASLLEKRVAEPKKKMTERGELLKYFAGKLDKKIPYVAFKVAKLSLQDLYYIKSACDLYEHDGNPWSKGFYGSLKPGEVIPTPAALPAGI